MSFESPGFVAHRADATLRVAAPVVSVSHESRLAGWFARTLGLSILALSALFALALLTWSVADPSFSNIGAGLKATNALGPIGAIVSDIVIQSLGLASVFALLPPVFWAAQLLSRHGIEGTRSKIAMAPVAVLCLAALLSGLPKAAAWPLGSGYGGLLGDFGFQAVMGLFGAINADRAPLVTGICLTAAGVSMLMLSLGVTPSDLKNIGDRRRKHLPDSGWVSHLKAAVVLSASDDDVLAAGPAHGGPVHGGTAPRQAASPKPAEPDHLMPQAAAATPPPLSHLPMPVRHERPAAAPTAAQPATAQMLTAAVLTPPPAAAPAPAAPTPPARPAYRLPPSSLLPRSTAPRADARDFHRAETQRARKLAEVLETYGVRGEVKGHAVGPIVTTFTVEPASGTRSTRLVGLADDIARGLGVASVRIQVAALRTAVTIEIPHDDPVVMGLRDFVEHDSYQAPALALPVVLGATAGGEPCVIDIAESGSVLFAGQDLAARSGFLDTVLTSLVYRHTPQSLRLICLGAPTFAAWASLPHLAAPTTSDVTQMAALINWAAAEIESRTLRLRAMAQAQTIAVFNAHVRDTPARGTDAESMPYLVLMIGDLAALLSDARPATLAALDAILRRGRATGVHLMAATTHVGDEAVPAGLIAAFQVRLAGRVANKGESRALLGETGAENLQTGSDALLFAGTEALRKGLGGGNVHRLHVPHIRPTEAQAIATAAARQGDGQPEPARTPREAGPARTLQAALRQTWPTANTDSVYDRAVACVRDEQVADPHALSQHLGITRGMANELLDQMSRRGHVSGQDANGQRRVLVSRVA